MTYYKCDGSGKVFSANDKTIYPEPVFFYKYTFSREFYDEVIDPKLTEEFHKCNHEMKVYFQKVPTILDNLVKNAKKKK